jgi:integrase
MRRDPKTGAPDFFSFARDFLHAYLPKTRGLSPKTIEAYRISLECYLSYLAETKRIERDRVSFDHFDRQHLKGWMTWMADQRHYATKTVTLRLSAVKAFLAYASCEDLTLVALSQAAKALKAPAHPRTPIEYLDEPETRAILAAFAGSTTKSRRNRMLLILLYDTAARVGECGHLTWPHFGPLFVTNSGPVGVVIIPGRVGAVCRHQCWPHPRSDRSCRPSSLSVAVREVSQDAVTRGTVREDQERPPAR